MRISIITFSALGRVFIELVSVVSSVTSPLYITKKPSGQPSDTYSLNMENVKHEATFVWVSANLTTIPLAKKGSLLHIALSHCHCEKNV